MTDDDQPVDEELEYYESYNLAVTRIDGLPHANWDSRWLPIDPSEEPPLPVRETLISATVDPGAGFMADDAYYELAKIGSTTLAHISRIDGIGTEVSIVDFEEGSEEPQIQAFIDEMQDMEPEAELVGDEEDEDDVSDAGRRIEFHRG